MTRGRAAPSVGGMNVIVGIDAREQQADALALGADLARPDGGRLLVAYVYPWSHGATRLGTAYARTVRDDAIEVLRDATRDLDGVDFEIRAVPDPSVARGLHRLAEEENADLVVIGSPHRGVVGRTLVGGTAERVTHGSATPVAVAPRGYTRRDAPALIGVAYDASDEAAAALAWATRFATTAGAKVKLLSAYEPTPLVVGYPAAGNPYDELDRTMRRECRERLDAAVASLPAALEPTGEMLDAPVAHSLAEAAKELDMLVAGSRGYGPHRAVLLGSVTQALSHASPCPLVVLPRGVAVGALERSQISPAAR